MTAKPVVPRERALTDVDDAIAHDLAEASEAAALGFVGALQKVFVHIARHPATESPSCANALNLPGLRHWPLTRYPHLVFCVELADRIDVWRVLHGEQDIPAWMRAPEGA